MTARREVKLHIACQGNPRAMRVSDSPAFPRDWTDFQEQAEWILPEGDGIKTVFVQVRDANSNRSAAVNASIRLDLNTAVREWSKHR